jgi:hypothetical protein
MLCVVYAECYTWTKIFVRDKYSGLHCEHVFCLKTIWSTQLFWSTLALADTFLVDKIIWPTLWLKHFLSDKIFWSTKCFTDTFLSTKCFGRHLFGQQDVLAHTFLSTKCQKVNVMFWSKKCFTDTLFGRQNDLADKNVLTDKTLVWAKGFQLSITFSWLGYRSPLMLSLCRPKVCRSNCFR